MTQANKGRFTSKTGRAAGKAASAAWELPEPTVKVQVVLYARQAEWLREQGANRSALLRELLDRHIESQTAGSP